MTEKTGIIGSLDLPERQSKQESQQNWLSPGPAVARLLISLGPSLPSVIHGFHFCSKPREDEAAACGETTVTVRENLS